MMRTHVLVGALMLLFAETQGPAARPDAPLPAAIGIVRSDGILFPLARVQDGVWTPLAVSDPVDSSSRLTQEARALARSGWSAFPLDGKAAFPLTIGEVAKTESHCMEMDGFYTDAPKRAFPRNTWPRPKTALAVFGAAVTFPAERLSPPYDGEPRRAASFIVTLTQSLEAERVEAGSDSRLAKYTAADRARVPVQITTMSRRTFSVNTAYYFEARKRYPAIDVFVSGWLVLSQFGVDVTHVSASVTDDDYKGVETATVLGVVELPDRAVWVLEAYGYESEAYVLVEFSPFQRAPRLIRIEGGGC